MQVTETSSEGLRREFRIVVPADDIESRMSRRLDELGRAIRLPGFRPGKVPMQILRRRYGAAVWQEVIETAKQDGSAEAIRERNLRPALPPRIEKVKEEEGGDLEYMLSLEVLPELPEVDFGELALERLVAEVPDEDVDKAVERLAEQQRKSEPVERPAANGDIVVADYVGRIGDAEFPGGKGENISIELGAGQFIPGFEGQLVGAPAGERRTITVTFPEDYGGPDLAGKEAVFDVTVKEVRERKPAAIDDELAQQVGLDTLDELRQEIRQRMQRDFAELSRQRLKRALLDKLAERCDFPVPPGMLDIEFESLWRQYEDAKARNKAEMQAQDETPGEPPSAGSPAPLDGAAVVAPEETALEGASDAEAPVTTTGPSQTDAATPHAHGGPSAGSGADTAPLDGSALVAPEETALEGASDTAAPAPAPDDAEAREEYRRIAERRVRLGLLLAEVGRNNNINVTQEELNQALAREVRRYPGYERQLLDIYRKTPGAVDRLRAPIFEDKVVDFIIELAKIDERKVPPQELMAFAQEEDGAAAEPDDGAPM
jgi:trigger factor